MGIETFLIIKPLGLFHEAKVFSTGSLNFIIFSTAFLISIIFLLFNLSLSKVLTLIFFF